MPDAWKGAVRQSLERYQGKTLKEALDAHSRVLDPRDLK